MNGLSSLLSHLNRPLNRYVIMIFKLFCLFLFSQATPTYATPLEVGRIVACHGICYCYRDNGRHQLSQGSIIREGDELVTSEKSALWVLTIDQALLRMYPKSTLSLLTIQKINDGFFSVLRLGAGAVYMKNLHQSDDRLNKLETDLWFKDHNEHLTKKINDGLKKEGPVKRYSMVILPNSSFFSENLSGHFVSQTALSSFWQIQTPYSFIGRGGGWSEKSLALGKSEQREKDGSWMGVDEYGSSELSPTERQLEHLRSIQFVTERTFSIDQKARELKNIHYEINEFSSNKKFSEKVYWDSLWRWFYVEESQGLSASHKNIREYADLGKKFEQIILSEEFYEDSLNAYYFSLTKQKASNP